MDINFRSGSLNNKNMKIKINILIIGIVYLATLFAQNNRYLDEVFDEVIKTENVVYGNAPDLPFFFWVESKMDVSVNAILVPVSLSGTGNTLILFK